MREVWLTLANMQRSRVVPALRGSAALFPAQFVDGRFASSSCSTSSSPEIRNTSTSPAPATAAETPSRSGVAGLAVLVGSVLAGAVGSGVRAEGGGEGGLQEQGGSCDGGGPASGWAGRVEQLRRLTFFKYEKRLREYSTTEKIFDYFSSIKQGKSKFMTETDLMRSVVPVFPVEGVRSGSLDGEYVAVGPSPLTRLGSAFDVDGNGRIDFKEYLFFLHFMSVSLEELEGCVERMDVDQNGMLNIGEMQAAIGWAENDPIATSPRTGMDTSDARAAFMPALFGDDGTRRVPLNEVREYFTRLNKDLAELEFKHYDFEGKGFISGEVFAYAAVSSMPIDCIDVYLARIVTLPPHLKEVKVTRKEFQHFVALHGHLNAFREASQGWSSNAKDGVCLRDFSHAVRDSCKCALSDAQLEILLLLHQPDPGSKAQYSSVASSILTMLEMRSLKRLAQAALKQTDLPWKMGSIHSAVQPTNDSRVLADSAD